jgi:hypothetical protein
MVNRWDGLIPGRAARGGLNCALDEVSAVKEAGYYSGSLREAEVRGHKYLVWGRGASSRQELWVKSASYSYRLERTLAVVDLRAGQASVASFLTEVARDPLVRAAQRDLVRFDRWPDRELDLAEIMRRPDSSAYLVTRALGVAALTQRAAGGLVATSARVEPRVWPGLGLNVVLGGDDGTELYHLRPEWELLVAVGQDGRETVLRRDVSLNERSFPPGIPLPFSLN